MNFKTPFKVLTTAALIGTLSLSAVAPGAASAAEKTVTAQAETPANFAIEKVILVKGDSKISVSFDTYIDALGNETALNGYELAYVVAANGEVFALDTYVDFYEEGNTEEEVVEKLSKAGKTSEVTEVKDGAFNNGKLEPVEDTAATAKADLEKAVAAAKATEIKDAAAKAELTKAIEAAEKAAAKEDATKEELEAAKAELTKAVEAAKKADAEAALEAKVESVTAINAQQIKVTFNKELAKDTAEDIANYEVNLASDGQTQFVTSGTNDSSVKLQDDKKSVIIDLDPANLNGATLTKGANYEVKVLKDSVKDANGKYVTEYTKELVFADTEKPTVSKVTATATNFVLTFSEPVDLANFDKGIVKVNGVNVPATSITAGADKYTVNVAYTTEADKEYTIYTSAFSDLSGNKSEAKTLTTKLDKDTVAPKLESTKQVDDLTVAFKFSEELAAGTKATIYRDTTTFANAVTLVQDADDKTLYTAEIDANIADLYPTGETTANVKVQLSNFKDAADNLTAGSTQDLTLKRTVKTPAVESIKWDGTNAVIKLDTVLDHTSELASKLLVTDSTGAEVSATAEVASDATGTDADGKYIVVSGLAADKEYTLNFTKGFAKDKAVVPNETGNYTLDLTTKSSDLDKTAPELASGTPVSASGNVITVKFNESLAASARTLSNFTLDGEALPEGTVAVLTQTTSANDTIKITLPEGSIVADAAYELGFKNIKDLAGNTAKADSVSVNLNDTVKPVLESAVVNKATGKATLTFSEKVASSSTALETDFIVKVNGIKLTTTTNYTVAVNTTNPKVLDLTFVGVNAVGQKVEITTTDTTSKIVDTATTPNVLKGGITVTATEK